MFCYRKTICFGCKIENVGNKVIHLASGGIENVGHNGSPGRSFSPIWV